MLQVDILLCGAVPCGAAVQGTLRTLAGCQGSLEGIPEPLRLLESEGFQGVDLCVTEASRTP